MNNENIINLGDLKKAKGLYIIPEFIDLHTRSDFPLILDGGVVQKVL